MTYTRLNPTAASQLKVQVVGLTGTWAASAATTLTKAIPAVTGYTPIGLVGATTGHGSVVLIRALTQGGNILVEGRNLTSGSASANASAIVLYAKS